MKILLELFFLSEIDLFIFFAAFLETSRRRFSLMAIRSSSRLVNVVGESNRLGLCVSGQSVFFSLLFFLPVSSLLSTRDLFDGAKMMHPARSRWSSTSTQLSWETLDSRDASDK